MEIVMFLEKKGTSSRATLGLFAVGRPCGSIPTPLTIPGKRSCIEKLTLLGVCIGKRKGISFTCSHIVGEHSTSSISFLFLTLLRFYLRALLSLFFFLSISLFLFYLADVGLWLRHHVYIEGLTTKGFSIFTQTGRASVKGTCELDEGITLGKTSENEGITLRGNSEMNGITLWGQR